MTQIVVFWDQPGDYIRESFRVGFMNEGFRPKVLADPCWGMPTATFLQLIGYTPREVVEVLELGTPTADSDTAHWKTCHWTLLGLNSPGALRLISERIGMPLALYRREKSAKHDIECVLEFDTPHEPPFRLEDMGLRLDQERGIRYQVPGGDEYVLLLLPDSDGKRVPIWATLS